MKKGKTITELANELHRQAEVKRDFIADTRLLGMIPGDHPGQAILQLEKSPQQKRMEFKITPLAHQQIAERLKIPFRYYDRLRNEAPALLAENVNHWFDYAPEERMIRTLDNQARAFLSNRYRRLDNGELLQKAVLPALSDIKDIQIKSCEVTDNRLYIKAVTPKISGEVKKGDVVQAGIVISNSEVGMGTVSIEPLILRLVCDNGMIAPSRLDAYGLKKFHVGRRIDVGEAAAAELLSDEALRADDQAFWLKARDVIKGVLDQQVFQKILQALQESGEKTINGDPVAAVKELANRYRLNDIEEAGIRTQLMQFEEATQYGLLNAVTRFSQQVEDYDRATELERIGGDIIDLAPADWQVIAEAA